MVWSNVSYALGSAKRYEYFFAKVTRASDDRLVLCQRLGFLLDLLRTLTASCIAYSHRSQAVGMHAARGINEGIERSPATETEEDAFLRGADKNGNAFPGCWCPVNWRLL